MLIGIAIFSDVKSVLHNSVKNHFNAFGRLITTIFFRGKGVNFC